MAETRNSSAASGAQLAGINELAGASVHIEPLLVNRTLPLLVRPREQAMSLSAWGAGKRGVLDQLLLRHGAFLFRGFHISGVEDFQAFAESGSSGGLIDYTLRSTPRKQVTGKIYTSTEYPANQSIPLHNEMSYTHLWPMKIWFYCMKAAARGGATPIADSARVYERIRPDIRNKFTRHGVMYARNYRPGVDLSYKEVFGTEDRIEIEMICREAGIRVEFTGDTQLRTWQICQAVAIHPAKGCAVWFNQAHLFHISNLDAGLAKSLLNLYGETGLPRNASYGDGSAIDESDLNHVRDAYQQELISFPWQEGDVMMLDNMLVAHGREPFSGDRKVVVAMAEQCSSSLFKD